MHAPRPRPRGFALLLVLMMSSIVLVLAAELAYQSNCELLAARNVSDLGQIEYAIDGQFEVVLANLRFDKRQNDVDSENDGWASESIRSRRDGDVGLTTRVFDEQSKFNLTRLVTGSDAEKARSREVLVRLLDLFRDGIAEDKTRGGDLDVADAEDIADRIIRHLKREGATGQVPKPKLVAPWTDTPMLLDELLFVDTKDSRLMSVLLYDVQAKDKVAPGLHRYLTVYGTGKVNLNTAPVAVLKAQFSNLQDRDFAQKIVDRRRQAADETSKPSSGSSSSSSSTQDQTGNPYTDVNQLTDGSVDGLTAEVLQRNGIDPAVVFDVKSDWFGIRIQGATERTQRDELYVVQRAKDEDQRDSFRYALHQERTDPLLEAEENAVSSTSG